MAKKMHQIKTYTYSFDARTGGPWRLHLWDDKGVIARINFVDDASPIPAPTFSPDLNNATVYFRRSALLGLIDMLRNESPVRVTITDQPPGSVIVHTGSEPVGEGESTRGLANSTVVCSSCAPDLLAAKTRGILEAMRRLVFYCGADALPEVCPVIFHLDGDSSCPRYHDGMTGTIIRDATGLVHVCLYDVEKPNRSLPFTVENAQKIEDQLLAVHEALHVWFIGRQANYRIQEPFCKLISLIISEHSGGPEYCWWFSSTPDDSPEVLMKYLCQLGMTSQQAGEILKQVAQSATDMGRALSDAEFANVVTIVLGQDAVPAFHSAGFQL